jgi:CMP-N,N'-diacetyllegionaminic acid synthase
MALLCASSGLRVSLIVTGRQAMQQKSQLTTWAIIPARGGSKGIPRKNIKRLGDKPVLQYTAEQAQAAGLIDRIIVSTEDPEIAQVAQDVGLEVPFLRPSKLAQDHTPTIDAVLYTLEKLLEQSDITAPDIILLLQPTFPFRNSRHLSEAIRLLAENSQADSLVSVSPMPHHYSPFYAMTLDEGRVNYLFPGQQYTRRQDQPQTFYRNGVIYATRLMTLLNKRHLEGDYILSLVVEDAPSLINLDTPQDWQAAEQMLASQAAAAFS